jgi:hypothetical protein
MAPFTNAARPCAPWVVVSSLKSEREPPTALPTDATSTPAINLRTNRGHDGARAPRNAPIARLMTPATTRVKTPALGPKTRTVWRGQTPPSRRRFASSRVTPPPRAPTPIHPRRLNRASGLARSRPLTARSCQGSARAARSGKELVSARVAEYRFRWKATVGMVALRSVARNSLSLQRLNSSCGRGPRRSERTVTRTPKVVVVPPNIRPREEVKARSQPRTWGIRHELVSPGRKSRAGG